MKAQAEKRTRCPELSPVFANLRVLGTHISFEHRVQVQNLAYSPDCVQGDLVKMHPNLSHIRQNAENKSGALTLDVACLKVVVT